MAKPDSGIWGTLATWSGPIREDVGMAGTGSGQLDHHLSKHSQLFFSISTMGVIWVGVIHGLSFAVDRSPMRAEALFVVFATKFPASRRTPSTSQASPLSVCVDELKSRIISAKSSTCFQAKSHPEPVVGSWCGWERCEQFGQVTGLWGHSLEWMAREFELGPGVPVTLQATALCHPLGASLLSEGCRGGRGGCNVE